jgi:hypothetical protein
VARVVAFVPDLLFGSNVIGGLTAAGHEAVLVNDLKSIDAAATDVLIIDLTFDAPNRVALLQQAGLPGVKTLAFYLHTEADVRALAKQAGVDLAVPRSRMAREGATLVARLSASD